MAVTKSVQSNVKVATPKLNGILFPVYWFIAHIKTEMLSRNVHLMLTFYYIKCTENRSDHFLFFISSRMLQSWCIPWSDGYVIWRSVIRVTVWHIIITIEIQTMPKFGDKKHSSETHTFATKKRQRERREKKTINTKRAISKDMGSWTA